MNLNSGNLIASATLLWFLFPFGNPASQYRTPATQTGKPFATRQSLNRSLIEAIKHNDTSEVRLILAQGANPNFRFDPRDSLTHPDPRWAKDEQPQPVSPPPTALLVAVSPIREMNRSFTQGDIITPPENMEIIQALLDHGADPNARGAFPSGSKRGYDLWTPVESAIFLGRDKTIDLLLAHGAHIERDSLICAADHNFPVVVTLLLNHGVRINARDGDGNTALIVAAEYGAIESEQVLLDLGANVNLKNHAGQTALLAAVHMGIIGELRIEEIVKHLLDRGADVNVRDREGDTPMFYVLSFQEKPLAVAIAKLLIAKGADVNARNRSGNTLLQLCNRPQLARVLKDAGAVE